LAVFRAPLDAFIAACDDDRWLQGELQQHAVFGEGWPHVVAAGRAARLQQGALALARVPTDAQ